MNNENLYLNGLQNFCCFIYHRCVKTIKVGIGGFHIGMS